MLRNQLASTRRLSLAITVALVAVILATSCTSDLPINHGQVIADVVELTGQGTTVDASFPVRLFWYVARDLIGTGYLEVSRDGTSGAADEVISTVALSTLDFEYSPVVIQVTDENLARGQEYSYTARLHWEGRVSESTTRVYAPRFAQTFEDREIGWTSWERFLSGGNGDRVVLAGRSFWMSTAGEWTRHAYPDGFLGEIPVTLIFGGDANPVVGFNVSGSYVRFFELTPGGVWVPFGNLTPPINKPYLVGSGAPGGTTAFLLTSASGPPKAYVDDGAGWVVYDGPEIGLATYSRRIAVGESGETYVAFSEASWDEPVIVYEPVSGWSRLPAIETVAPSSWRHLDLAVTPAGSPVVAYEVPGTNSVKVWSYDTGWVQLGSAIEPAAGETVGTIEYVDLEIAANGTVYVMVSYGARENPTVYALDTTQWAALDIDGYGAYRALVGSSRLTLVNGTTPAVAYDSADSHLAFEYMTGLPW